MSYFQTVCIKIYSTNSKIKRNIEAKMILRHLKYNRKGSLYEQNDGDEEKTKHTHRILLIKLNEKWRKSKKKLCVYTQTQTHTYT